MSLEPCPQCRRHVASTDVACPFCGAVLESSAPRPNVFGRLSRAAIFAGVSACYTNSPPPQGPPPPPPPPPQDHSFSQPPDNQTRPPDEPRRPDPPAAVGTATITGIITDGGSHQPVAGVNVVCTTAGQPARVSQTDSAGRYKFDKLPAGHYQIQIGAMHPVRNRPRDITVADGETKQLDAAMPYYPPSNQPMPYGAPPHRRRVV